MASLLGAVDGGPLLRLADEVDAFLAAQATAHLGGDIVLALTLGEGDQWNVLRESELLDAIDEAPGHRVHQR